MLKKKRLISIDVSYGGYEQFVLEILNEAKKKRGNYVCVANVHMLIEAWKNKDFSEIVNSSFITTPDGMPLVWLFRILYGIKQERVAGMDLFPSLLKESEKKGVRVFFYGSEESVLREIVNKASSEYPLLKISGYYSPPFRELTEDEKKDITELINAVLPDIVFISLGCPKQEKWMYEMRNSINSLMIGVGAAFLSYSGRIKRAPLWMQKMGLEWFYRLIQEPKRLFRRYLITNTIFVLIALKELFKKFVLRKNYE